MIEIYRLDATGDPEFILEARYNDDQTVDGDNEVARSLRNVIQNWQRDPAEDHERIEAVLIDRYSNSHYKAVQS